MTHSSVYSNSIFLKGSVFIYGLVVLLDPTNSIFHLKVPAFALCLSSWILFSNRNIKYLYLFPIIFSWLLLTYGMIISDLRFQTIDIDYKVQISNLYFLTLLFLPFSSLSKDNLISLIFKLGLILTTVIWLLYFIYTYSVFGQAMYLYFTDTANLTVMIAKRTTLGIEMPMFFYKTAPFLLLPMAFAITSFHGLKRIIIICFFLFPIIIGGSRTPILCALLLIGISSYLKSSSQLKNLLLLICGISFLCLVFNIVDEAQTSNELKFDSYDSYISSLTKDIDNFMFGNGIGSLIFIPTRGWMAYSELSIMDLYNQYGAIIGTFFLVLILYPGISLAYKPNKDIQIYGWSYLLYMIISSTNPLLFSSTGWFIWTLVTCISIKIDPIDYKYQKNDFSMPRCV